MRRLISPEKVQRASILFGKYGGFATLFSRFVLGIRTALLVASGLLKYPVHRFLAFTFAGAVGWLFLIYSLFDLFGLAATAVFGFRWNTALAMILFGGTATAFLAARSSRKRAGFGLPRTKQVVSCGWFRLRTPFQHELSFCGVALANRARKISF